MTTVACGIDTAMLWVSATASGTVVGGACAGCALLFPMFCMCEKGERAVTVGFTRGHAREKTGQGNSP